VANGKDAITLGRAGRLHHLNIGTNALFGWWWADPLAALGMTVFVGREALEAWRGEDED
jgi:hypothetical protein